MVNEIHSFVTSSTYVKIHLAKEKLSTFYGRYAFSVEWDSKYIIEI